MPEGSDTTRDITRLLHEWRSGESAAGEQVMDILYPELRRLAAHYMRGERPGHTLQPTALVNELYLKLMSGAAVDWQDRAHFFAFAARKLRHILVDHARHVRMAEQKLREVIVPLQEQEGRQGLGEADVVDLDHAMQRLEGIDARACRVLELRFFAGLTEAESAEVLGIAVPTVKRDFAFARAWLAAELTGGGESSARA
jgi:RNA polymerase sigma factor (TIGR02999 family)